MSFPSRYTSWDLHRRPYSQSPSGSAAYPTAHRSQHLHGDLHGTSSAPIGSPWRHSNPLLLGSPNRCTICIVQQPQSALQRMQPVSPNVRIPTVHHVLRLLENMANALLAPVSPPTPSSADELKGESCWTCCRGPHCVYDRRLRGDELKTKAAQAPQTST